MTNAAMAAPPWRWGGVEALGGKSTTTPRIVFPGQLVRLYWKTGVRDGKGRLELDCETVDRKTQFIQFTYLRSYLGSVDAIFNFVGPLVRKIVKRIVEITVSY
jgi:hypothetical protein